MAEIIHKKCDLPAFVKAPEFYYNERPENRDEWQTDLDMDKLQEYKRLMDYDADFRKLMRGINPKTGRKIKFDGDTYETQMDIRGYARFTDYYQIEDYDAEYEKLTRRLALYNQARDEFDAKHGEEVERAEIQNNRILDLQTQIYKLKSWDSFVEFDGKRYGLPAILFGEHRENDCGGSVRYGGGKRICRKCGASMKCET